MQWHKTPVTLSLATAALNRIVALAILVTAVTCAVRADAGEVNARATFVLICDIYKMNEKSGRGGIPRVASVVKSEKAKGNHVYVAHAGDAISPSLMSGFEKGAHMIDLLNMLPIDIFVPGNHEFDFGPEIFIKRMGEAKFPVYAANLANADGRPFPNIRATRLIDLGGARIGLIGVTAEDSVTKSSPGNLKFDASVRTVERLSRQLRKQGADMIVAVAHAGRKVDDELLASGAVDVLLSGDDHDLVLRFDGKRAMVEAMQDGLFVAAVDLEIRVSERDGRRRVKWWPHFRLLDTADYEPEPQVAARVAKYEAEISRELDVAIGRTETNFDSENATVRGGEAALGNLFADAVRTATGADVAILNGGGIRGGSVYPAGSEITRRHVLSELPYGDKTLVLEMTGAQIREVLEQAFAKADNLTGAFPHVSGIKVRADLSRPAGQRVVAVLAGGKQVADQSLFKVATNEFLTAGGDGLTGFTKGKVLVGPNDAKLIANHVMAYIRRQKTVSPKIEGRVVVARGAQPR